MSEKSGGRRFKRKLTPFLAHQMLFDYATDQLDPERKTAVEEFLETDQEGRTILANLKLALAYVDQLGRTTIDAGVLEQLKDAESPVSLGRRYSSWNQWPEPLRWSLSAIAISCVVAAFVALVPWNMLGGLFHFKSKPSDLVQVAEIPQNTIGDIEAAEEPVGSGDAAPEDEGSGDEEMGDEVSGGGATVAANTPNAAVPAAPPRTSPTPPAKAPVAIAVATPSAPVAIAPASPTPVATPPSASQQQEVVANEENSGTSPQDGKAKGYVYRAFMNLANIEDVAPQLTDAIRGLGGEKSGEVELGWKRGSGRYYHFALPEENEKKLLDKLQAYGPVRISKDPHPRVMPAGRVRFILWVESSQ
ncbi:MAG: hypothetical protein V4760_08445 [Bdellovibrionota bacterium]